MPHKDPEVARAYGRAWSEAHREQQAPLKRRWALANREKVRQIVRDQQAREPVQTAARSTVRHAIRDGRLVRQPCEICGTSVDVHAHHAFGYDGANAMAVWWLCRTHHGAMHAAIRDVEPGASGIRLVSK